MKCRDKFQLGNGEFPNFPHLLHRNDQMDSLLELQHHSLNLDRSGSIYLQDMSYKMKVIVHPHMCHLDISS
jgi:hypothetical protein